MATAQLPIPENGFNDPGKFFIELFNKEYSGIVQRTESTVRRVLQGRWDVAEPSADAVFTVLKKGNSFSVDDRKGEKGSILAFASKVALDIARDFKKNKNNQAESLAAKQEMGFDLPSNQASILDDLLTRERARLIFESAQRLPTVQRTVFMLRHNQDLETGKIAEMLQTEPGNVSANLNAAYRNLRKRLSTQHQGLFPAQPA